jgi:hypothetical protein
MTCPLTNPSAVSRASVPGSLPGNGAPQHWPRARVSCRSGGRVSVTAGTVRAVILLVVHHGRSRWTGQPGDNPRSRPAVGSLATETTSEGETGDWIIFSGNDELYLLWISKHPSGYVVNAESNPKPSYLKLHRATCPKISAPREPGAYTERQYLKNCSLNKSALERWARDEVGGALGVGCACLRKLPLD